MNKIFNVYKYKCKRTDTHTCKREKLVNIACIISYIIIYNLIKKKKQGTFSILHFRKMKRKKIHFRRTDKVNKINKSK